MPGGGIAPGSDQAGHGGAGHRQNCLQLRGAAGDRICFMMAPRRSAPVRPAVPGTRQRIFPSHPIPSHPISVTATLTRTGLLRIHPQMIGGDDHRRRARAQPRAGGNLRSCALLGGLPRRSRDGPRPVREPRPPATGGRLGGRGFKTRPAADGQQARAITSGGAQPGSYPEAAFPSAAIRPRRCHRASASAGRPARPALS
jgi:hypothetical protein